MSQIDDLITLVSGAARRPVGLRGTLLLTQEQFPVPGAQAAATGTPCRHVPSWGAATGTVDSSQSRHTVDVVAQWPNRWRLEGSWTPGGPALTVIDGDEWMHWSPGHGAVRNSESTGPAHGNPARELLDPRWLLTATVTSVSSARWARVPTLLVTASVGDSDPGPWAEHRFPVERGTGVLAPARWGVHDHDAHVDRETGLVICLRGRVQDRIVLSWRFDRLEINVDIDDEPFALQSPDGSPAEEAWRALGIPHEIPFDQAAGELNCPIFTPTTRTGEPLPPQSSMIVAGELHGTFRIDVAGSARILTVRQRSLNGGAPPQTSGTWQPADVSGHSIEIGTGPWNGSRVRAIRRGILIDVSAAIPLPALIQITTSMRLLNP